MNSKQFAFICFPQKQVFLQSFFCNFFPTPILGFLYSSMNSSPLFSYTVRFIFTLHPTLTMMLFKFQQRSMRLTSEIFFSTPPHCKQITDISRRTAKKEQREQGNIFWRFLECQSTFRKRRTQSIHRMTMSSHEGTNPRQYFIQKHSPTLLIMLTFSISKSSNEFLHHFSFTCGGPLNSV